MLLLAPMEGLLDHALRETLTQVRAPLSKALPGVHASGWDRCVSEFIRITDTLLPPRAFLRVVPELAQGGCTQAGVPVRPQLLGSDPQLMAENAARLAEMGAPGVDLNFGCPAKVVNRHGGGSALLQDPELVHRIVHAVRQAVPVHVPVSAKMRLGYHDDRLAEDNARAIADAGAHELVVHARTKAQAYRPPAYWERIADLHPMARITLVANGEMWTVTDALNCLQQSGCVHLMLGRGAVADPGLAWAIRWALHASQPIPLPKQTKAHFREQDGAASSEGGARAEAACGFRGEIQDEEHPPWLPWNELLVLMHGFWQRVQTRVERRHRAGRLKQWLNLLRRRHPSAQLAFDELRMCNDPDALTTWLARQLPE